MIPTNSLTPQAPDSDGNFPPPLGMTAVDWECLMDCARVGGWVKPELRLSRADAARFASCLTKEIERRGNASDEYPRDFLCDRDKLQLAKKVVEYIRNNNTSGLVVHSHFER